MSPPRILDSHIHLWPETATQPNNHGWMTPGHQLAKRHGISDYIEITGPKPFGFVYVETDRYLPSSTPEIGDDSLADDAEKRRNLEEWAKEPLNELRFLRRIVEGKGVQGDGFSESDADLMKGCVVWAPCNLSPTLFTTYLQLAEEVSGPQLWSRIVGFRYLLQGKAEGEVKALVESNSWVENIVSLSKGRKGKGWTFDIGVDTNRDGVEMLECVVDMISEVRKREDSSGHGHVRFILNHLSKPALSTSPTQSWLTALSRLTPDANVYMKLSGAFNEFPPHATPSDTQAFITAVSPFFNHVFKCFPSRVMFGSDWPVCNVGGPRGEDGNWRYWVGIVEGYLDGKGEEEREREGVWWRAGCEAYGIEK